MTRSIFDPGGGETERSGNQNLGADAANRSHMPPDVVDGKSDESDAAADAEVDAAHANVNEVAVSSDEAADRLASMQDDSENAGEGADDVVDLGS
jgi:hypothetical protein